MDKTKQKLLVQDYIAFWKSLCPGIKPVPSAIWFWESKIERLAKKNRNLKALILGVTPEIRDLLSKYQIDTVCLDFNPIMAEAMTHLVKKKNQREKIVIGDWLKMPFPQNNFDLVIADCPQDNLPYQKFNLLFQNIYRVLKPDGYLMLGTTYFKGFQEAINLKQYIKIYRKNSKAFKDLSYKYYYLMRLSSHKDFYNQQDKVVDWPKIDEKLKLLYRGKELTKRELDGLKIATDKLKLSLACKWTWITSEEFLEVFANNHFDLLGFFEDDANLGDYFRQALILKKKSL